ncbi:hypothetical protein BCON_0247g00100 [Botryotinia convoluta]|uniref:Uncharacterized protein n=1 Tax=Botryotinia convoluta TaxID=54673 RepID=A0A4Z1HGR1_9HELO|nr:hypothetical protein BCON_0247g00100 [Botryotinia convoluta]
MIGNPQIMASKALHWNAPRAPPRYSSQDENIQSLGEVKHKDKLREVDSSSPIPISSSLANPVPVSSGKNDELQEKGGSSKVIIDGSCLVKSLTKAKIDELGKNFPSDLPYIITYENKSLEAICQECDLRLKIEGSAIGGITKYATSIWHGFNVKQRLDSNNLEETSTSKVMARGKAMENPSEPNSCREVQNQRKSKNEEPWEFPSIEVDPARPVDHSEPEPRKSKRRKFAPAFLAETDTSDLRKQRDQILLFNADLIGLRNFHGKRLDTLEQISEKQKHELKVCNENFRESKAQTDASFQKDKISLAIMESELEEQKEFIDDLTKLLSNAECKLEDQKKVMNNLADLFPGVESKLNEQKEVVNSLASKLESDLKGQKETTTNLAELMNNRLTGQKRKIDHLMKQLKNLGDSRESEDLLRLHTENELQNHHMQIANLEQKISRIRYDATKEVSEIIKKQNLSHVAVDRIEKVENSIEGLNRRLEDPFPTNTFEAIVDRVVGYTAENHNRLEEMVREVDKRHSSQRASLIEALETKMSCTSQAAIDRVANLEGSLKELQAKLTGMASIAVEPQSFQDKLDSLETCTQGFQKWLDEIACESAEQRLQQDNLRTEFLKRQALESQIFMERIVKLEKDTTHMTHLVEENKMSGELIRKYMLKFRYTSDQVAQLKKEVQSYENKLRAVAVALDNRRLQQLKEHTELIEEKMSHTQTDFDNMVTRSVVELSNIAIQAAKSEMIGKNSSRDHQIDDLIQSIRPIILRLAGLESTEKQSDEMVIMRLAALEKNEKRSDDMIMIRLAALEEKNERDVSRIVELERGNESLQRELMKLWQPIVK